MKHFHTIGLLSLSLSLNLSGFAETIEAVDAAPPQQAERMTHGGKGGNNQSRMLQHLLEMDDAQLTELRTTIERIQSMGPEEKVAMKQRLKALNKMPRDKVDAMRKRFEAIPKETRDEMRQRWHSMSPEERRELREKLRGLSPEERKEFIEESGVMPPRSSSKQHRGPRDKERPQNATNTPDNTLE